MNDRRKELSRKRDKVIFKNTAQKTKKVNIKPRVMRGGIRL